MAMFIHLFIRYAIQKVVLATLNHTIIFSVVLCQVERRFHNQDLNHQPLHFVLGTSPLSTGS